jgi:hypothetical protein
MTEAAKAFEVCSDDTLVQLVGSAARRLVVVAPAVSMPVANAICERWTVLGSDGVSVVLDADPEVYRLGYGEPEALTLLVNSAQARGVTVRRQPGVRIGLVIADDETLVYSPTPLSIEAGPHPNAPGANAIRLGKPTPALRSDLALDGQTASALGNQPLDSDRLAAVTADLTANPPRKFDVARTERVFNALFEFVEFELHHTFLDRKKVQIPAELMGLARDEHARRLLTASSRLVDADDALSGARLSRAKNWIIESYLTNLPGYGNVVVRTVKPEFEQRVEQLRRCVERFGRIAARRLQGAIDRNREALVDAFLPAVLQSPPRTWRKYGPNLNPDDARRLLGEEFRVLFGEATSLIRRMNVRVLFKGVTYETLLDEKFQALVKQKLPFLAATHREHHAAPESLTK